MELASVNPTRSEIWYRKVFGIETKESGENGRFTLSFQGKPFGSISPTVFNTSRNMWVPVLQVAELLPYIERVADAGGEILMTNMKQKVALILDPQGAVLALKEGKEVSR